MARCILATLIVVVSACSGAPVLPAPTLVRTPEGLPAFRVQCRNDTAQPISPTLVGLEALRLDGEVIDARSDIGSWLGGPPADVPAGGRWTYVVVLHPGTVHTTSRVELQGDVAAINRGVPLERGAHRVAFQCAGRWTAELPFEY